MRSTTVPTRATVRPFPWSEIPSVSREDVALARAARRRLRAVDLADASAWLGARLAVDVHAATARPATEARDLGDVTVVLAPASSGAPERAERVVVVAERALAAAVVARVLRRRAPKILDDHAPGSTALVGAFAAIVVAAARRTFPAVAWRLVASGASGAGRAFSPGRESLVDLALTVRVDGEAFGARLIVPRASLGRSTPHPFTRKELRDLGRVPLTLSVVACTCACTASELASLRAGDALLVGPWTLARDGGGASGPAWLCAPDKDTGVSIELGEGGRAVLRGGPGAPPGAERPMTEANDPKDGGSGTSDRARHLGADPLVDALAESVLTVRVEIGDARMTARDWASLASGDVVLLGRRIGDTVLLRVDGVPVARGELVDVEGEVGVRVVERLGEGDLAS